MLSEENLQRLQEVPIFKNLEREQTFLQLAANLEEKSYPSGFTILKQGEPASFLYIILSGSLEVHIGGFKLAHLQTGDYFGEMALFDSEPHSASVTTLAPSKCLILAQDQIYQAIQNNPEIGLHIISVLCQRIRKLNQKINAWLRGLLTLAWADGEYSEDEKQLIEGLVKAEISNQISIGSLKPISATELAVTFADDPAVAENFLRTAVIVALANGTYSDSEDQVLREFCIALKLNEDILDTLRFILVSLEAETPQKRQALLETLQAKFPHGDVLYPVRNWLDEIDINTPFMARFLCKLIPPQCPFERDIVLFGHKVVHIPPMCKLNPLYEQLVGLRFRSLCYLADVCKEDISGYI